MTGCLLCGGEAQQVLEMSTVMIRSSFVGTRVVRCRRCGLDYLSPTPASSCGVYEDDYWRAYQDAGMVFPTEAVLHARYHARLLALQEAQGGPGRLLEIGIGHGGFLNLAAQAGWDAIGVELSKYAAHIVEERYGLRVVVGSIETAEVPQATFDVVHMSHVLEHLVDPLAALARIRTLLVPGGVLVVEVPNELENLHVRLQLAIRRVRPYTVPSTHICFFTPASLRCTLERAGYWTTRLRTMRDETDPRPLRRAVKRAAGVVESWLGRGPLIEAFAVAQRSGDRAE